jgi:hypothetical protein
MIAFPCPWYMFAGENLAGGGKLNRSAYQVYSDAFGA